MRELKTIQTLIEEKAKKRLEDDLRLLSNYIRDNSIMAITDNPGIPEIYLKKNDTEFDGKKPYWFFDIKSPFMSKLKEYWLPIYISKESEMFIQKVDELFDTKSYNNDY